MKGGPEVSTHVELYNADGTELLKRVDMKKAINMIHRQVARPLEVEEGPLIGPYHRPRSLVLVTYRYSDWKWKRARELAVTRRGVLRRDKHTCAYCGKQASTIDHVFPKSRGGADSWENLVAACLRCNNIKDDRTPKEAGMRLLFEPRVPTFEEIFSWGKV